VISLDIGHYRSMRILLTLLAVLVVVPAAATATRPRVWLSSESPAVVRGTGFHAAEHVTVTVSGGGASLRRAVVATATGTFVARWQQSVQSGDCGAITVRAVGDAGSRAGLKIIPECAALQP
jgi:hypothetical protein